MACYDLLVVLSVLAYSYDLFGKLSMPAYVVACVSCLACQACLCYVG